MCYKFHFWTNAINVIKEQTSNFRKYIILTLLVTAIVFLSLGKTQAQSPTQKGLLLHSGSMCSLAGSQLSEQCLKLGGWGAYNSCNKPVKIICPVLAERGLSVGGDESVIAVDTYGANVRARAIWQSRESWNWRECPQVVSTEAGFNELRPTICDGSLGDEYLSLEVVLPSQNTRVYGYHPVGVIN